MEGNNFWKLEYDRWDICSAACQKGKEASVPVYKFLKNALVRKYGEDFYAQMEGMADYIAESEDWFVVLKIPLLFISK